MTLNNGSNLRDENGMIVEPKQEKVRVRIEYFSESEAQATEALSSLSEVATATAASVGIISLVGGMHPALILGLVTLMQMFLYLLFFNIDYPANLDHFLKTFTMVRLDFLPDAIQPEEDNSEDLLESPPRFYENEFSGLFLQSAGFLVAGWVAGIAAYLGVLAIRKCKCLPGTHEKSDR